MTNIQDAKDKMYKSVDAILSDNSSIFTPLPSFSSCHSAFQAKLALIDSLKQRQELNVTGIASEKSVARTRLEVETIAMSAKVTAWAAINNDFETKNKVKLVPSEVKALTDMDIQIFATIIHGIADINQTHLTVYGITAQRIIDFATLISEFADYVTHLRIKYVEKSSATKELKIVFKDTDAILKNKIDYIVRSVCDSQPTLVTEYFSAREILNPPAYLMALMVKVIDDALNIPMANTKITVLPDNVLRRTRMTGTCKILHLTEGTKQIIVSKTGYIEATLSATVVEGETEKVEVRMKKGITLPDLKS